MAAAAAAAAGVKAGGDVVSTTTKGLFDFFQNRENIDYKKFELATNQNNQLYNTFLYHQNFFLPELELKRKQVQSQYDVAALNQIESRRTAQQLSAYNRETALQLGQQNFSNALKLGNNQFEQSRKSMQLATKLNLEADVSAYQRKLATQTNVLNRDGLPSSLAILGAGAPRERIYAGNRTFVSAYQGNGPAYSSTPSQMMLGNIKLEPK
ncbi:hypothetical protein 3 [Beihai picorna-like virus 118]|uniref:hypothetical protein 3 n=1 Tax=Beihai picorna-like virus 118 TaxID=1922547 RepID=UPI00090C14B7|nr:hypothetical protein 3 [Beihai picorna-like virus 118]APG76748.1 hypothetical protein 3 [Beihai picorna-like virus 118]